MRFDLKKPCKNCPFSKAETRIKFANRERAEEIEETAYRNGFPCHKSADFDEDEEYGGYVFGRNTQHCAGSLAMHINEGESCTPGTGNDEDLFDRLAQRLDLDAAFESIDAFLEANE
jgi:hypothetical protein